MPSDIHTHIYICVCVCVCVCTHTHTHTHTHAHTHTHKHTYTLMHIFLEVHLRIMKPEDKRWHILVYMCTFTCVGCAWLLRICTNIRVVRVTFHTYIYIPHILHLRITRPQDTRSHLFFCKTLDRFAIDLCVGDSLLEPGSPCRKQGWCNGFAAA